jgi:multidrug efflux pump subunit AcrB
MLKHFHEQRNRSIRLLAVQAALALAGGSVWFLMSGPNQGRSFASGVLAIAAGQLVQSFVSFSGGVQGARKWFGRFLLATLLKWIVVFTVLALCVNSLRSAPLAILVGIMVSLLTIQLFNFLDAKVKRGS